LAKGFLGLPFSFGAPKVGLDLLIRGLVKTPGKLFLWKGFEIWVRNKV